MSNFDASTPQLKIVKNLIDAITSLNLGKVATVLSKNFQYGAFYVSPDLAKMDNERFAAMIQGFFGGLTKLDIVCHEVIEAPGKVIVHGSASPQAASGATFPYDAVAIVSIEEEDGELKVLSIKTFPDTQKHNAIMTGIVKAATEGGSTS